MQYRAFVLLGVLGLSFVSAVAQESKTESQAIRCSAVYFVMTSVTESNPALNEHFTAAGRYYFGVYGRERSKRALSVTNGELMQRREAVLKEFAATHRSNPVAILEEALLCMSWTDRVRTQGAFEHPETVWPTEVMTKLRAPFAPIISAAFDGWAEGGYATPGDVRKQIGKNHGR